MFGSVHKFFISVSLLFGIAYALVVPPFQVADEFNHFYRSYQIAQFEWTGERTENRLGGWLPCSLDSVSRDFRRLPFHMEEKTSRREILEKLDIPLNREEVVFLDFANTSIYAPTAYPAQGLLAYIALHCDIAPMYVLYWSRIGTLLLWVLIVAYALRLRHSYRWLLAFLALLPASLILSSGNNADVISNAFAFLFISFFLNGREDRIPFTARDYFWMAVSISLLTLNKIVYFPLLFLLFMIPDAKYGGLRNKLGYVCSLLLINVALVLYWMHTIQPLHITYDMYDVFYRTITPNPLNENVNHFDQMDFILSNPFLYGKILFVSFFKTLPHTVIHYIGKFGWEKNYLYTPIVFVLLVQLILYSFSLSKTNMGKKGNGLVFGGLVVLALGMIAAVATFLYLNSCAVGGDFIYNLSGKYFIPIFPLLFIALSFVSFAVPTVLDKYLSRIYSVASIQGVLLFALLATLYQVVCRYYF